MIKALFLERLSMYKIKENEVGEFMSEVKVRRVV
jgi:hypothetical protein